MITAINFIETEETIKLTILFDNGSTKVHFLDADDDRWQLILRHDDNTTELYTSTNGDFS